MLIISDSGYVFTVGFPILPLESSPCRREAHTDTAISSPVASQGQCCVPRCFTDTKVWVPWCILPLSHTLSFSIQYPTHEEWMCSGQKASDNMLPYSDSGKCWGFDTLLCNSLSASNKAPLTPKTDKLLDTYCLFLFAVYFCSPLNHYLLTITQASALLNGLPVCSQGIPYLKLQVSD